MWLGAVAIALRRVGAEVSRVQTYVARSPVWVAKVQTYVASYTCAATCLKSSGPSVSLTVRQASSGATNKALDTSARGARRRMSWHVNQVNPSPVNAFESWEISPVLQ